MPKTSKKINNDIVAELVAKGYYVTKPFTIDANEHKDEVWVYSRPEGGGINYEFAIVIGGSTKKSVSFNGEKYTDVDGLLAATKAWAETLPFPTSCYDPAYNKRYLTEVKIHYVLNEKFGYKYGSENFGLSTFKRTNMYNEVVSEFLMKVEEDGSGKLLKTYQSENNHTYTEVSFKDGEDAYKQINSLLLFEGLVNMSDAIETSKKVDAGSLSNLDTAKSIDIKDLLNPKVSDYKAEILPKLKELVAELER